MKGKGYHGAFAAIAIMAWLGLAIMLYMPDRYASQFYSSYYKVPYYRKQWFFWLMFFTIQPIAIVMLIFGDVYYEEEGMVKSFGLANKIIAGIIAVAILLNIIVAVMDFLAKSGRLG